MFQSRTGLLILFLSAATFIWGIPENKYELWGYIKSNINVRKTPASRTMNLKICKFPRVHLTRFRLVQRQSATVTAHTWALSRTLSCAWFYCLLRSYKSTLQICWLSEHVDVAFITNQIWGWLPRDCYVLWKVLVQAMHGVFQLSCEYYIHCSLYMHKMLLRRLNIRHMRNKWRAVKIYILPPVRQF